MYRAAYDVPLRKTAAGYQVRDATRIEATLPTLKFLIKQRCRIAILTWCGRPNGRKITKYKLDPVAKSLSRLIGQRVKKLDDCVGSLVEKAVSMLKPGEIAMLENVRFHPEEETKNVNFMKQLAASGEIQVFDAFAQAHRSVASIIGPQKYLPTVSGLLLEREIKELEKLRQSPKRPYVAVIGGAKIEDKVELLKHLIKQADYVLLGGVSANAILQAKGVQVGKSRLKSKALSVARQLDLTSPKLKIPVDVVTAKKISGHAPITYRPVGQVQIGELILDIGPDTIKLYQTIIKSAKTVMWSGPMGYFEIPQFADGTFSVARAISKINGRSIVGGGDTESALDLSGYEKKIDYVSTGGGAMLEYLAGQKLPGLKFLD